MSTKTKKLLAVCSVFVAAIILIFVLKPSDRGGGYDAYFSGINEELKRARLSRPCIVLDLDRVDLNLKLMMEHMKPPLNYRIVTKSLPSPDLVRYVVEKTGSDRFMVFHRPDLVMIFREMRGDADILTGKPFPVEFTKEFFHEIPAGRRTEASKKIQWLVDSRERLIEYLDLAKAGSMQLRISLEIDVGLHRGGARTPGELGGMLEIIEKNPRHLKLAGFMGYEGHVPHVPLYIGYKESAIRKEFSHSMKLYQAFYDYGKKNYPGLMSGKLAFNSGGSKTYRLFTAGTVVNDIAAGSCVVKPSTFDDFTLSDHRPALFIAAPVLKKLEGFGVPFIEWAYALVEWWNANLTRTFYVYGGGWNEKILAPAGVEVNALTADPPNANLMPNQSMLNGSRKVKLDIGDFVFYHPLQGDAISQFERIVVMRKGKIIGYWKPFSERY